MIALLLLSVMDLNTKETSSDIDVFIAREITVYFHAKPGKTHLNA